MYCRVVTVNAITSGGPTQDITFSGGTSFTPSAAIVQWSGAVASNDTFVDGFSFGYGFTDGTNSRCVAGVSEDATANSDTARIQQNNAVIVALNQTGTITTVDALATFSQWLTDGMRISWSNLPTAAMRVTVMFLGGTDLTNVTVGSVLSTTGSSCSVSGLGWQPEWGMFLCTGITTENSGSSSAPLTVSLGAVDSSENQWCQTWNHIDGSSADAAKQYYSHSRCITIISGASLSSYSVFESWDEGGFTITHPDTPSNSSPIYYIVGKGGAVKVGNATEPAGTGQQTITTNTDVKGVIILGNNIGTADTISAGGNWISGMGDSTLEDECLSTAELDASDPMATVARHDTDAIYVNVTANATASSSTIDDEASLYAVSSSGFTLDWTNIGQARPFRYIAFGNSSSTLYERALNESSISVSETLARTYIQPRSLSESSISVSETPDRILYANRSLSESSISVSETLDRILTAMRTLDESDISVSEDLQRLRTAFASISESSIPVSETLDRILTAFRVINESTIDVSETVSGNLFFLREISEAAIAVSETLDRTLYANRAIDENVAVSESVDRILTAFRTIGEAGISVSETLNALFIQVRSIDESVSVSETLERMTTFFRTITESSINVSEQLDRILTANRIISESSIAVSETLDRQLLAFRTLAESAIAVSETLDRVLTAFRVIDESSIAVSETVEAFVPIVRTINEAVISVSETVARLLSAFRVIGETVNVSDQLAIVGPDYEIARFITDKGYMNPLRVRIRFVDRHDENRILYTYDAFNPDQRPFNILGASIRLAQGEIGIFTIDIEDSAKTVIKDNIGFGTKVQIDVKKEYGTEWNRVMTGFVRRRRKIRAATNTLQWQVSGVGTQVVFNERVTNYKRAAKRSSVDSIDPLPTDSRMFASNLFKDLISATDILPLRRPSLMETGGFTLDQISPDVVDFIAQVAPGLTDAASVANAFSELTGAIWGCNSEGNPFFRYPTQKHSGIIIKDDPQDTDSALITSTNMDAFDYEDTIDLAEGFANRLYVLNAVDTKSTASSSGASGSTTLTWRGIAQQFTATDNNITSAAFILSKVGNPSNKDNCVFGYLRGDNNGYPTGATLASFQITFDQIDTAKSTIFVNDIKPKEGTIIPGNKYWWFLFSALTSESNTIRWHHDNDQLSINRFSAILPMIDQDPTKPGNQLLWTRSDKGPVYAFSTFSSIRHILEHSDPESIKEYGLVEGIVDLPAFEDDPTFQKALVQILKTASKPKRIYNYNRVTIPTQRLFFPGELVTVIDSKADLTSEKNVIAEIAQVQYIFDTNTNALGCKYVDVLLMGFVDKVLDDYLDNNTC